jgi:hypothetical protein
MEWRPREQTGGRVRTMTFLSLVLCPVQLALVLLQLALVLPKVLATGSKPIQAHG